MFTINFIKGYGLLNFFAVILNIEIEICNENITTSIPCECYKYLLCVFLLKLNRNMINFVFSNKNTHKHILLYKI